MHGGDALSPGSHVRQTKYTTLDGGAPILDENAQGGDGGARRMRPEGGAGMPAGSGARRGPRPGASGL